MIIYLLAISTMANHRQSYNYAYGNHGCDDCVIIFQQGTKRQSDTSQLKSGEAQHAVKPQLDKASEKVVVPA